MNMTGLLMPYFKQVNGLLVLQQPSHAADHDGAEGAVRQLLKDGRQEDEYEAHHPAGDEARETGLRT